MGRPRSGERYTTRNAGREDSCCTIFKVAKLSIAEKLELEKSVMPRQVYPRTYDEV